MEIIIIGGILVIVMVIVSTRIKKSAAAAYGPEMIETSQFLVEKPEGFLHPLRDPPDFPFEAYSKLFGDRSTRNIWRARIRLRIFENTTLQRCFDEIELGGESVVSTKKLDDLPKGQNGLIVRSHKSDDEVPYKILRKLVEVESQCQVYELKTSILATYGEEYTDRVCQMMGSFMVK